MAKQANPFRIPLWLNIFLLLLVPLGECALTKTPTITTSATATATPTPTTTTTFTKTNTFSPSATPSTTPTPTLTATLTFIPTSTPTISRTRTSTNTFTLTNTQTLTNTPTPTNPLTNPATVNISCGMTYFNASFRQGLVTRVVLDEHCSVSGGSAYSTVYLLGLDVPVGGILKLINVDSRSKPLLVNGSFTLEGTVWISLNTTSAVIGKPVLGYISPTAGACVDPSGSSVAFVSGDQTITKVAGYTLLLRAKYNESYTPPQCQWVVFAAQPSSTTYALTLNRDMASFSAGDAYRIILNAGFSVDSLYIQLYSSSVQMVMTCYGASATDADNSCSTIYNAASNPLNPLYAQLGVLSSPITFDKSPSSETKWYPYLGCIGAVAIIPIIYIIYRCCRSKPVEDEAPKPKDQVVPNVPPQVPPAGPPKVEPDVPHPDVTPANTPANWPPGESSEPPQLPLPPLPARPASLLKTRFMACYNATKVTSLHYDLLGHLHKVIQKWAQIQGVDDANASTEFFKKLEREALTDTESFLNEMDAVATRFWTSGEKWTHSAKFPNGKCFHQMINELLTKDEDRLGVMADVTYVVRAVNQLVVTRHASQAPTEVPNGLVYRGGGLPDGHQSFFRVHVGKQFRFPVFYATSFNEQTARRFALMAKKENEHPALYIVKIPLHPVLKIHCCMHANLVNKHSMFENELEYLFAPYSVFSVRSVTFQPANSQEPHLIYLEASQDNMETITSEPLDLAAWW